MDFDPKRGAGKASDLLSKMFRNLPRTKTVRGEVYVAAVFQILSKDDLGRPKDTKMIHEEETVHLEGGEEFMVGFVLKTFTEPNTSAKA
jgi:hypothetical protein